MLGAATLSRQLSTQILQGARTVPQILTLRPPSSLAPTPEAGSITFVCRVQEVGLSCLFLI